MKELDVFVVAYTEFDKFIVTISHRIGKNLFHLSYNCGDTLVSVRSTGRD